MPRSDRSNMTGALCGLWWMLCAVTLCASANGAGEREPFREPDWVSMPGTEEGVRAAREVLTRAQAVYAGMKNYEHDGVTKRTSRAVGSRVRQEWDDEEPVAAAFDRATGRYSHALGECRVWFDGERVIVRLGYPSKYRTAASDASAAPEKAVELLDQRARLPMSLKFLRGAEMPLDELLESMSITELVGVIPEPRDGKNGKWVVMASHQEVGERGVRMPRRFWFDDEKGMLRAAEEDQTAWYEANRSEQRGEQWATTVHISTTVFSNVVVDAPGDPAMLAFRPGHFDKEVTTFAKAAVQDQRDWPAYSPETPAMVDCINRPLLAFKAELLAGGEFSSESLKGKPALIGFGWAGEQSADLPYQFQRILEDHGGALRAVLLLADVEQVTKTEMAETHPVHFKGDAAAVPYEWVKQTFGAEMLASAMLVDGEGVVRDIVQFRSEGDRSPTLESAARKLVSGELRVEYDELGRRRNRAQVWRDYWQNRPSQHRVLAVQGRADVPVAAPKKPPDHGVAGNAVQTGMGSPFDRVWFDVDHDGTQELVIPGDGGRIHFVRPDGRELKSLSLDVKARGLTIRTIRPVRSWAGTAWVVLYYRYDHEQPRDRLPPDFVEMFDAEGRRAWKYEPPAAVTPLAANEYDRAEYALAGADLTGDGIDEILIACSITRHKKVEGELNSWSTDSNAGRSAVLVVLDSRGRTLSMTEFGADKIGWIEPLPGTAAVMVSLEHGVRRVDFKDLQTP